jgi:alkanesulfonate monooxygenase SsuD/methylene tetrahydromethanopterin reductase-like flavin-dependent oxidoreductase (luciferase family)
MAIQGPWRQPIFEGWASLAAWAALTSRIRLGLMVGANTFRNPGLTAKLVTTLDHISDGRAILGIGGAWFEREHDAHGIDFGASVGERLDRLDEAVGIIRRLLDGEMVNHEGPAYRLHDAEQQPRPIQAHLPILVGGGGERVTLKLVARYADACNIGGGFETVRRKEAILREHCQSVGRDHREIERTTGIGTVFIRDDRAEAERLFRAAFERNGKARPWADQPVGTPEDVAEKLAPYLEIGYRHFVAGLPATYDEESMTRLISEVKPILENGG